jgi:hypothetical protein
LLKLNCVRHVVACARRAYVHSLLIEEVETGDMVSCVVKNNDLSHVKPVEHVPLQLVIVCRQIGPLSVTHDELKLPIFRFHTHEEVVIAEGLLNRRQSKLQVILRVHVDTQPCSKNASVFFLYLVLRGWPVLHSIEGKDLVNFDFTLLYSVLTKLLKLDECVITSLINRFKFGSRLDNLLRDFV